MKFPLLVEAMVYIRKIKVQSHKNDKRNKYQNIIDRLSLHLTSKRPLNGDVQLNKHHHIHHQLKGHPILQIADSVPLEQLQNPCQDTSRFLL